MIYTGDFKNYNMITWLINEQCNFQCDYCWEPHNKISKPIDTNKLAESLNYLKKDWLFYITGGGEPFLEKNIIEICREITKKHYIAIYTNLSTANVFDFTDNIASDKCLYVYAAVHITEREKKDVNLSSYIEKMLYLQKKGFNAIAYYVAHPLLFDRIKPDILFLKSNGIQNVRIKIFNGIFNGKYYPFSFNSEQKEFLETMEADYPEFEILKKSHTYHGQLCHTGQKTFVMNRNGDLKRCHSSLKNYGNLFEQFIKYDVKPKPCPKIICECASEGIKNIISEEGNLISKVKEDIIEQLSIIKKEGISKRLQQLFGALDREGVPIKSVKEIIKKKY